MTTKINKKIIAAAAITATTISSTHGFVPQQSLKPSGINLNLQPNQLAFMTRKSQLKMAESETSASDEIAELRAAAAKMREEANRMAKEMGKEITDTPKKSQSSSLQAASAVEKKSLSAEEVLSVTANVDFFNDDAVIQTQKLDALVASGDLSLWKSAASPTSTALRTYPVTLNFLESRSDGKLTAKALGVGGEDDVSLDDFKYATLWVTGGSTLAAVGSLAFLPDNIGATLCYFFALVPILFLGVGSSAPGVIAGAIQATRGGNDDEEARNDRICRHEAGHFLCGYLCGLPIKNYEITDTGFPCVEFHPSSEMSVATANKEFSREEIAALTVVAMSGSVAEALKFEQARGGDNDLLELDGLFRRSKEFLGAAKQQDLTRWGALAAYQLLKANIDTYEKLVVAFREKKSVAECIAFIEGN